MSNYIYYGKYRHIGNTGLHILLDFHAQIHEFPLMIMNVANEMGVEVKKNKALQVLDDHQLGMALHMGNQWIIVYDDSQTIEQCRVTVTHEISHILLGHTMIQRGEANLFEYKPEDEKAADMLTIRLLSPACILWALDLHTAEDIANWCEIPMKLARQRAARMAELYKRDKFLTNPLEQRVFMQFLPYLKEHGNPHRIEECSKRIPNLAEEIEKAPRQRHET